ncbi:hypothetical protein WICMUC_001011 [Wickerhamomyces mucosus]|uniref:Adenylyl cyclase-associated protein n=1 Tax=Wickerhamomyces mucosus TaxID=1378264 RepID=A0A9P8PW31_9ASCO|nr:hypothetical protein WICMUC_001011 [Wickerhamomyces mucosus]
MSHLKSENFQLLFERLEKATTALESIVDKNISQSGASAASSEIQSVAPGSTSAPQRALSDLELSKEAPEEVLSPSIKAFNEFLELYVDPFVSSSKELDSLIGEQASLLAEAFNFQKHFIKAALISQKPDFTNPKSVELIAPLQETIGKISDFKDKNRKSDLFNNLNSISEGTGVLSWLLTETPQSYITDIKDSATFWTNKVLKQFKGVDNRHVDWVKQFLNIFEGLKLYAKQYHTTGLTYKSDGGNFASSLANEISTSGFISRSASETGIALESTVPSAGGPPPPPPPPPPPSNLYDDLTAQAPSADGGLNAVFSELNQGEAITKSLKKVDRSQMTHKNPELRSSSVVAGKRSPPVKPKKPSHLTQNSKPDPVIELNDSKWIIKNVEDNHDIIIDGEISQSIFIADSKNATIQIKGKANAVSISSTTRVGLVVESLVSGVDVINSKKFGIQILDIVPTISIDKSDEGSVYLSEKSLATEIYTSSTTALNINIPQDDDFKEVSIPEQFKHTFASGKLQSEIVEHAG